MADVMFNSVKFIGASIYFTRTLVNALVKYYSKGEYPLKEGAVRGIGMDKHGVPKELPLANEICRKIPTICFKPTVAESMYYVIKDIVLILLTYWAVTYVHSYGHPLLYWPAMLLYWAFQGTLFTAVFVIGHDCGHQSFSRFPLLNDTVGQLMHAFLFCPFFMWKLSHKCHHKNTNNFEKDEVFYPVKKSEMPETNTIELPGFGFGMGWFVYLIAGYSPRRVYHYSPVDPMFGGHFIGCCFSLLALGVWGMCLAKYISIFGAVALFYYWFIPVFIFASYTVVITFLHHNEMNIPWYNSKNWDFVRGQLATIDRDYGIVSNLIHDIGVHQMHHMFTKIPHYRLNEATKHFRKAFPELVRFSDEPILTSFMRMFRKYLDQSVISDDTEEHFYN